MAVILISADYMDECYHHDGPLSNDNAIGLFSTIFNPQLPYKTINKSLTAGRY